jgi:hypothetical protein
MVFYKCDKCSKEFNHKYNYLSHKNRKNPCIQSNLEDNNNIDKDLLIKTLSDENITLKNEIKFIEKEIKTLKNENKIIEELKNEIKFIEKETKILSDENTTLKNKNKVLEEEKNIFKGENITLKNEIKEKQQILNNKDIEINKLYKNRLLKDKDGDIKIKTVQGYVYIIRECDFVRLNEDIYKIGITAKNNPEDRFEKYRKGTEIIGFFKVNDSIECEKIIIKCFSNHANITKKAEYGKEYFQGNKNELLSEILEIVKNYNN